MDKNLHSVQVFKDKYPEETSGIHFHFWNKIATNPHSHDYYEFFIVTEGEVLHTHNLETTLLHMGDVGLVRPSDSHQFSASENASAIHLNVAITPQVFEELCSAVDKSFYHTVIYSHTPIYYSMKKAELDHFLYLTERLSTDSDGYSRKITVKTIILNIIAYLRGALDRRTPYPEWFDSFLSKIKTPEYFLSPIHTLYSLVPYSQPRLNTYFNEFMGETLVSFITKMKINYASSLLKYSNYSIIMISEMARYNSLSHFNHTFKKQTGLTPTEYRRKYSRKIEI